MRIRLPDVFVVVYFSRGTQKPKKGRKGTTGGPSLIEGQVTCEIDGLVLGCCLEIWGAVMIGGAVCGAGDGAVMFSRD